MIRDAIGNFPKCDCETICDAVGELLDLDAFANDDHCEVADEDADLEGDALGDNDESVWIDGVQIDLRSPVESIAPIVPVAHRPFVFSLAKK